MKPIELPILFNTDEGRALQELGIDHDDYEPKMVTFYSITAISDSQSDPSVHSCLWTASGEFVCTMSYEELKQKLADNY